MDENLENIRRTAERGVQHNVGKDSYNHDAFQHILDLLEQYDQEFNKDLEDVNKVLEKALTDYGINN